MNDLTSYAKQNEINPRKAQRYREKLNIGTKIAGRWILTDDQWDELNKFIADTMSAEDGTKKQ